jgi:hypothetical protein
MPIVEVQAADDVVWAIPQPGGGELPRGGGGVQGGTGAQRLAVGAPRELERGNERGGSRGPEAAQREQILRLAGEQPDRLQMRFGST